MKVVFSFTGASTQVNSRPEIAPPGPHARFHSPETALGNAALLHGINTCYSETLAYS